MAKFQIYTYMFRPVMENQQELPFEEFEAVDVQDSLNRKQELLGNVLMDDKNLKFMFNDVEYEHKTYIQQGGIFVFRIANNNHRPAKVETGFKVVKLENHPSCLVIIDNRKDRQVIAIEHSGAFSADFPLAPVLESTFRHTLQQRRLSVDVKPKFYTAEFWKVVDPLRSPKGIEYVKFPFPYPNLPEISDLVGEFMSEMALNTNSEPTLYLQGQNKESLRLSKEDLMLLSAIKACAASGRPIVVKPKGAEVKKIGVESPVYEEISNVALEDLNEKDLFDSKFQIIVKFLNTIKLVYE